MMMMVAMSFIVATVMVVNIQVVMKSAGHTAKYVADINPMMNPNQ